MKRPEWVKGLIEKGMSKEDIIAEIQKGNESEGIKPTAELTFAKLIYNKIVNSKPRPTKAAKSEE